jgi:hypothetical protein
MTARFTNVSEVPLALGVFLASDYYDYNDEPNTISATTLLKPLRQIILPSRMPPGEGLVNLADMMSNRLGAAIHDGIEKAWVTNHKGALAAMGYPQRVIDRIRINPTPEQLASYKTAGIDVIPVYMEQRLKRKLGKWTVTGKFDFIGEGRVTDFKSASVWSYMNQVNVIKQPIQGSIYRWLDPQLITQDEMDIIHIFMDWKAGMVKTDPAYPPQRFKRQVFPLMSVAETGRYIQNKVDQIAKYWSAPEPDLPPCEDEDLWRSEPVFKYYKSGDTSKTRSTKNFDNMHDARLRLIEDGGSGAIREVPGTVTACKYCPAFHICTQKDQLIAAGQLLMS